MSELYIPPERFERDFITGRFLKGCVSHNKGRKMVYHSKRSKARSIKNLSKGRGAWHKTGAGMNKKSVVLIKDEKLCGVFPSIQMAGKMIGVAPSLISAIKSLNDCNGFDCGTNEELFLAIAALRDDTDNNQLFTNGKGDWGIYRDGSDGGLSGMDFYGMPNDFNLSYYHKATVNELIEHFKTKEE